MMIDNTLIAIEVICIMIAFYSIMFVLIGVVTGSNRWQYDRNPYRRYCKHCGTGQSLTQYWHGGTEWETFLPVKDCKYKH